MLWRCEKGVIVTKVAFIYREGSLTTICTNFNANLVIKMAIF